MQHESRERGVDELIGDLAGRQHGRVARWQLVELGATNAQIRTRLEQRRLQTVHRGVYAVGHRAPSQHARWMAAVLAGGPGSLLIEKAAAALWGIRGYTGAPTICTPTHASSRPGIIARRIPVPPDEATIHHGIPVTTPARTLLDLAAILELHALRRAFHEAEYLELASPAGIPQLMARYPRKPGRAKLRKVLELSAEGAGRLRSDLEVKFARFLDAHRIPQPVSNRKLPAGEPDFRWPAARLIAEVDGPGHMRPQSFHADRARDIALTAAGYRVIRITEHHIDTRPEQLAAQLKVLLASAAAR